MKSTWIVGAGLAGVLIIGGAVLVTHDYDQKVKTTALKMQRDEDAKMAQSEAKKKADADAAMKNPEEESAMKKAESTQDVMTSPTPKP